MAQTLATIRGNVRNHIDEPSANYWTDAELNAYISARQLDLWKRIYALRKDFFLSANGFTLTLVSGQYKYTTTDGIPSDFFRTTAIRTTTSGQTYINWQVADPSDEAFIDGLRSDVLTTNPDTILYSVRANQTIWVSPIPQSTLAALVDYIQMPTAVSSDTDTFVIPDPFLDFIEYMATSDALAKGPVGDVGRWQQMGEDSWKRIAEALDMPRSDQNPDVVRGFMEAY